MDPIGFELFKNAIFSIADEMALTVMRTTYSGVLKDNMDYSTGFADAEGRLVAQGLTLPGHLGSVPTAMQSIMKHYREDIRPGDVFIMNDPFDGGMHLPDVQAALPGRGEARVRLHGVPSHRCGRPRCRLERLGLD
jgi:N-methylhydantoinase B